MIPPFRSAVLALTVLIASTTFGPLTQAFAASPWQAPSNGTFALPSGPDAGVDVQAKKKKKKKKKKKNEDTQASTASSSPGAAGMGGSFLGAWTDGTASQAAHLDQLGAGWARAVAVWSAIEPSDNAYNWADLDGQVNAAAGNGRRVLVMVRNNPAWAAASRCRLSDDAERTRLADFMTAMVNRYKDRVKYWQLYNEMDNTSEAFDQKHDLGGCFGTAGHATPTPPGRANYAQMLETVGAAIHAADKDAKVVSGAVVSGNYLSPANPERLFDADFLPGVLTTLKAHGTLDRIDYLAVHFFSSQSADFNASGPDLVGRVNKLRQDMRAAGLSDEELKPIFVDEGSYTGMVGTSSSDPNQAFNRAQRDYIAKAAARAAAADVVYFWFGLQDIGGGGLGGDNAYGLIATDGVRKPSYAAFRYLTSLVDRADRLVGGLSGANQKLEGYEFSLSDGRRLHIVWNNVDADEVQFKPAGRVLSVSDPVGSQVPQTGDSVRVGAEPRFIFSRP